MSYVYMKALENKAKKYDSGIKTLTLGKYPKITKQIVDNYLSEGESLLDIGMGTGTFAIKATEKGVKVTGIDVSKKMLAVAKKNIEAEGLTDKITIINIPVVELDERFKEKSFDKITAMLVFSELYQKEQEFTLKQIVRILKENGEFIIVDEVKPRKFLKSLVYFIIRIPIAFITFLKSRLSTKPLNKNFEELARGLNLELIEEKYYLLDTLKLIRFKKKNQN